MKKLVFGQQIIKLKVAICNWCGEDKLCFGSSDEFGRSYLHFDYKTELKRVIEGDVRVGMPIFGKCFLKIEDYKLEDVVISRELKEEEIKYYICQDCAKQIADYKS